MKIKVTDFGKDHFSLLAYIETLCVDSSRGGIGELDKRRIRCNPRRHPLHSVANQFGGPHGWKKEWGTRLSGFFLKGDKRDEKRRLGSHDDWDCMDDLEKAGLIEIISEANGYVKLTDKGIVVAGRLREWKAKGGVFATFSYTEPKLESVR